MTSVSDEYIHRLYSALGSKIAPKVIEYDSPALAFDDIESYQDDIRGYLTFPWAYSSPVSRPVTFDDGSEGRILSDYCLDLTGEWNTLKELYKTNKADCFYLDAWENHECALDNLGSKALSQQPALQMCVSEFIFVGGYSWLNIDSILYNRHKPRFLGKENSEIFECLSFLNGSDILLITFENVVLKTRIT